MAALAARGFAPDEGQRAVLARLEDLSRRLTTRGSLLSRGLGLLERRRTPVRQICPSTSATTIGTANVAGCTPSPTWAVVTEMKNGTSITSPNTNRMLPT